MADVVTVVRILSLTYAEERYVNAQQVNAREIARRLDPTRFRMTLLSDGSGEAPVLRAPAVEALRLPRRRASATILRRLLSDLQDVVLYPGPGLPESIYLRLPRWAPGRGAQVLLPVEGDVDQLDEVPPRVRRRVERTLARADLVFPITAFVAETLLRRTGRTGEIVPVGVDLGMFRPRDGPRAAGPMRVLSVGAVKPWKRPELACAAARALPEVEFTWVGVGDVLPDMRRAAPTNLAFVGERAREAIPAELRAADVLLHPGRREGLPKAVLEALASGVPVVAFPEWRPEALLASGAGIVVADEAEMVRALAALRDDPPRRERMGAAARRVAEGFGWDSVAARWASLFATAARRR